MERVVSQAYSRIPALDTSLWEYILVTTPDEAISTKLQAVGRAVPGVKKSGRIFNPYIKLAEFQARESMEETIIRWVQRVCNQQECFKVTLNNYGGFPPSTIFVRIQDHQPFRSLVNKLKVIDDYVQSNSCPPVKFFNRPNLKIGEQPAEADYCRTLFHYSQQDFHEVFVVSELILLKSRNVFDQPRQVNLFRLYPPDTNKHPYLA